MIITKTSLPRRTFLRGIGVTLALPLLDAMVPALRAATQAADRVHRLGFFYIPSGVAGGGRHWLPEGEGTSFKLSKTLSGLAPFRDQTVVVSGLSNFQAEPLYEGGGPHTRAPSAWLSGARPKRTEGADVLLGTTADQIAAPVVGQDTQLLSLELALEPNYQLGNCDNGYSCVYKNTFSWRTPTTPMPMETNPRAVFERLFGDGGSGAERLTQLRMDRSILDSVTDEVYDLKRKLGLGDRGTVGDYLDAVRDVERRIQKAEKHTRESPGLPVGQTAPVGTPAGYDEHAKMMVDLLFLAYQGDITRVATFQLGREASRQPYPEIGVPEALHEVSHHQNDPHKIEQHEKINSYHLALFSRLLEKMKASPDGDGSLLDHSMLLFGSGMGDGDLHSPLNLPLVLAGGGSGQLKGGRHLKYPLETPMANLLVSLLHKVGVPIAELGDSTGELSDL